MHNNSLFVRTKCSDLFEKLFHIFIRGKENGIEDIIIHEGTITINKIQ